MTPKTPPDPDQPVPVAMPDGDIHDLAVGDPGSIGMDGEVEIVDDVPGT